MSAYLKRETTPAVLSQCLNKGSKSSCSCYAMSSKFWFLKGAKTPPTPSVLMKPEISCDEKSVCHQ